MHVFIILFRKSCLHMNLHFPFGYKDLYLWGPAVVIMHIGCESATFSQEHAAVATGWLRHDLVMSFLKQRFHGDLLASFGPRMS